MKEFNELYNLYFEIIYKFAFRLLGDQQRAEDITQDTFLKLYYQFQDNKTIAYPKSWLYRVAANLSKNHLKRNNTFNRLISKPNTYNNYIENNLEEEIIQSEKIKLFSKALQKLSARDQIMLQLYKDGLSYNEIAEITNIKVTSIGQMLARAVSKCSKQIQKDTK